MTAQLPRLAPELIAALKRLKLGKIADTLPERLAARRETGHDLRGPTFAHSQRRDHAT